MYQRIVVPLDGSETAELALHEAERWGVLTGAPVHLVQVIELTQFIWIGPFGMDMDIPANESTTKSAAANEYLATVAGRLSTSGLVVETEVRGGQVVPELEAATRPGDLLIMASHGRSGVPRWFLGSVAEDVVRRATVPVLLVRASHTRAAHGEVAPAGTG